MSSVLRQINLAREAEQAAALAPAPAPAPDLAVSGFAALRNPITIADTSTDPQIRPYLNLGLQRAEELFFNRQPQMFPGQMYVDPSQQTLDALAQQEQIARTGTAPIQAGQQAFLAGLQGPSNLGMFRDIYGQAGQSSVAQGLADVVGGSFLGGSPFRDALIEASTRPMTQQFEQTVVPGISSQFSASGRYGSGAMQRAQEGATESYGRAIGDIASRIAGEDYARERQFQEAARINLGTLEQSALQQQLAAAGALTGAEENAARRMLTGAGQAGTMFAQQFLPSEQLAQIGASREAIAGRPLQENIARFQFGEQLPYSQLQSYLSAVYGQPMSSAFAPQASAPQASRLGTALGGAALGAGIGSQFFGGSSGAFGLSPTALGGIAGGLGGLLL